VAPRDGVAAEDEAALFFVFEMVLGYTEMVKFDLIYFDFDFDFDFDFVSIHARPSSSSVRRILKVSSSTPSRSLRRSHQTHKDSGFGVWRLRLRV